MSWGDIWKIILAALASVGGVAGLIILVVKFASNVIAERLSQKYQISLEKELESHKSKLDSKNYISKARFDREFAMYQELAEKHMTMVYDMGAAVMITRGAKYPEYEKTSDFIAETKGTMDSLNLRPIEQAKIACAKKLFNSISTSKVRYHDVDSYQSLLDIMGKL